MYFVKLVPGAAEMSRILTDFSSTFIDSRDRTVKISTCNRFVSLPLFLSVFASRIWKLWLGVYTFRTVTSSDKWPPSLCVNTCNESHSLGSSTEAIAWKIRLNKRHEKKSSSFASSWKTKMLRFNTGHIQGLPSQYRHCSLGPPPDRAHQASQDRSPPWEATTFHESHAL